MIAEEYPRRRDLMALRLLQHSLRRSAGQKHAHDHVKGEEEEGMIMPLSKRRTRNEGGRRRIVMREGGVIN